MNSKLLMSTLVCTLGLLAGSVNAKPQEGQPNRDMHRLFAGLELTESQKDQLKALHQAHQTENQALRDANQADKAAHQAKIKALLADPSFDDQQAQALISEGSQRFTRWLKVMMLKSASSGSLRMAFFSSFFAISIFGPGAPSPR